MASWSVLSGGLFSFLLLGGLFPLRTSPRRSAYHLRNSSALAAFLILGPEALGLVLPAALLSALCPFRLIHIDSGVFLGRIVVQRTEDFRIAARSILLDTLFLTGALLLTHLYYGPLVGGGYPVPLDRGVDLFLYLSVAFIASSLVALFSETYLRLAASRGVKPASPAGATGPGTDLSLLPDDAPLYGLLVTIGTPLQLLAHVLYLSYGTAHFLFGLSTFVIFVLVHSVLLQRRRRFGLLVQDLEVSQRLAALGELTGRIVHQTRHQLGLIGITVHLIRDVLDRSDSLPREKIRRELDRLEGVAQTLRQMLAGDLLGKESAPASEAAIPGTLWRLVRREVELLQAKARRRGVTVKMEGEEDALLSGEPREIQRLAEGIFNVVENAIAAAREAVEIRLDRASGDLRLVVRDDGPGIDEEFLKRACEPFTTTKRDGTGMGLAIALSSARSWDGDLLLQNEPGGGLKVTFLFPRWKEVSSTSSRASPADRQ